VPPHPIYISRELSNSGDRRKSNYWKIEEIQSFGFGPDVERSVPISPCEWYQRLGRAITARIVNSCRKFTAPKHCCAILTTIARTLRARA